MDDLSMVSVFVTNVLPAAGFVLGISAVWYGACLLIGGAENTRVSSQDDSAISLSERALDAQLIYAMQERKRASKGTLRDRIFLTGLMTMGTCAVIWLGLWTWGVVPASAQERAFIHELKTTVFANSPQVAAALHAAENASYISRQHYMAAEDAFLLAAQ